MFKTKYTAKLSFYTLTLRLGWLIYYSLISSNFSYKDSFTAYIRLIYLNLVVNKAIVV